MRHNHRDRLEAQGFRILRSLLMQPLAQNTNSYRVRNQVCAVLCSRCVAYRPNDLHHMGLIRLLSFSVVAQVCTSQSYGHITNLMAFT